ncbi:MAG: MFS transporter [bacterium]
MFRRRLSYSLAGVRSLAYARTIRYVGWGFGESLIPILIMQLTGSFGEAGLVRSSYEVTLLLAIPVLGLLAERMSAKWLVIIGLCIYPFVGLFYFIAGMTGLVAFVVVARGLNGIAWGLDSTGIDTYIRRMAPGSTIASSFGLLDTLSNFGWLAAALAGILLIKYFSIQALLFLVAPTALLALPFVLRIRKDHPALANAAKKLPLRHAYRSAIDEWKTWNSDLRLLAMLLLFTEVVVVLVEFFIPIDIYFTTGNLSLVILFTVVMGIPSLFGYLLGKIADRGEKARLAAILCGLMALVLAALALPLPYAVTVAGGLLIGTLVEFLSILQKSLATALTPPDHYGRLESVFSVIGGISDLAAPVMLGVALDFMGFPLLASLLATIACFLAIVFFFHTRRGARSSLRHLRLAPPPPPERAV